MHAPKTRDDVAAFIRLFLADGTEGYDWDDFVTLRFREDKIIDGLRLYLRDIYNIYPATEPGNYCSVEGVAELERIAGMLERGEDIEIGSDGVPRTASDKAK